MRALLTILTIFTPGALLLGFLLVATRRSHTTRITGPVTSGPTAPAPPTDPASLPDTSRLAGVPLRILLDDPSGPGAVLRDRFTIHPPHSH